MSLEEGWLELKFIDVNCSSLFIEIVFSGIFDHIFGHIFHDHIYFLKSDKIYENIV